MKDRSAAEIEVEALAADYCRALHHSDADRLEALCHDRYFMTSAGEGDGPVFFDKEAFVARVRNRPPFAGDPSFEILSVDVEGDEMAEVKLWVDLPPRRFRDFLGFYRVGGEWRLVTKLFRTASGAV
ncbi:MAG: nuclear transport factor 2 family protein [Pseudomonadota bacterium]